MGRSAKQRLGWCAAVAIAVGSSAAPADTPRMELGVGLWDHESDGTLSSDDPLLQVPTGFPLSSEKETYERFGFRLGSKWWAPVVRARHTAIGSTGSIFEDNSTVIGGIVINLDTTETTTNVEFDQLEGLLYFTLGDTIRAELGGGMKKIDGAVQTVEVRNTTGSGTVITTARRDLPGDVPVYYGGLYAEPVSWLSFGAEAIGSAGGDADVLDITARFVIKPWTWMGVEGGYRLVQIEAQDLNNTDYDFEFGGAYAGLSFLYGSKDAGLFSPDTDDDGVSDDRDKCANSTPGAVVDARGCEPDRDRDGIPDGRDDCRSTPTGAPVDARGCHELVEEAAPAAIADDKDSDGIADGQDKCAESPAGTPVDGDGCPLETPGAAQPAAPPAIAAGPDEDRDGVPDSRDKCRRSPRGFRVDARGCVIQQESVLQGITFQKNSSYLMRDSEVLLLDVVGALQAQRTMRVVIQGHTCDLGDAAYNKWLSQRRANRVLEFLVRHGIDASRLMAVGYGESKPLVPNDDERMRELNRRTVFAVVEQ